jgi:hypothetical protein
LISVSIPSKSNKKLTVKKGNLRGAIPSDDKLPLVAVFPPAFSEKWDHYFLDPALGQFPGVPSCFLSKVKGKGIW